MHVTEADLDQNHQFLHIGAGRYIDTMGQWPDTGRWRIHVQSAGDSDWRLVSDTITIGDSTQIAIEANYDR